jgi:hypothetical protein
MFIVQVASEHGWSKQQTANSKQQSSFEMMHVRWGCMSDGVVLKAYNGANGSQVDMRK